MSFEASVAATASAVPADVASVTLLSCLQGIPGRLWVVRLSGNFGDHLIWLGLETLLRRRGIPFEMVAYDQLDRIELSSEDTVYVHGGANWTPFWSGTVARVFADLVIRHQGPIVIGPSSFAADRNYLEGALVAPLRHAVGRVTVFCRERRSYELVVAAVGDRAEVMLDHDTALNLTGDEVLALGEGVGPSRGYRFYGVRDDPESRSIGPCRVLRGPVDPIGYCYSFKHWVRLHARAGSIVTNRLHSAICGSILGVPTTLLPNNYHKARGVWEQSLAARGVQWAERLPPDWLGELEERLGITRYWQRSRKFQRLIGRLRFGSSR